MPADSELEKSLRDAVRAHYADPHEDATVRSIRTKSELELGLEEGFYKSHNIWKDKSKDVIQDQFNKCDTEKAEKNTQVAEKSSLKRASPIMNPRPRKKSKVEIEDEESTALSEPPESATDDEVTPKRVAGSKRGTNVPKASTSKPAPKKSRTKPKKDSSTSELSDAPSDNPQDSTEEKSAPAQKGRDYADDSSSELSSVMDDPPPARKTSKSKSGASSKPSKSTAKAKHQSQPESDPKTEEIKRLQGWLVKCGIRKVWGKELKPFATQNAKIAHLKSMLADVGMTGRFSNEKAAQIKEARELAADIEAVQEGNERWGKDGKEEEDDAGRAGRRLVRGAKNYAFLSSDGEEESD